MVMTALAGHVEKDIELLAQRRAHPVEIHLHSAKVAALHHVVTDEEERLAGLATGSTGGCGLVAGTPFDWLCRREKPRVIEDRRNTPVIGMVAESALPRGLRDAITVGTIVDQHRGFLDEFALGVEKQDLLLGSKRVRNLRQRTMDELRSAR